MTFFMYGGLVAGFVWVGCLPWGAFPPPRVELVRDVAGLAMLVCVVAGLAHSIWKAA